MKVAVVAAGAIGAHVGAAPHRTGAEAPVIARGRRRTGRPGRGGAHCGAGRNVTLHVQDNEFVTVTSPHDNPVTHGNLCIKGRFGFHHVQNRV